MIEPRASLSPPPSQAAGRSASAIRSGSSRVRAIRSSPCGFRFRHPDARHPTGRREVCESNAASIYRVAGRARRAWSLEGFRRLRLGRYLRGGLLALRRAFKPPAVGNSHQPHGDCLVLRGSRSLVSSEKSHQRCSVRKPPPRHRNQLRCISLRNRNAGNCSKRDLLDWALLNELGCNDLRAAGGDSGPHPTHSVDMDFHLLSGFEPFVGFELASVVAQ